MKKFFSIDDIDFTKVGTWGHGLLAAVISAASNTGVAELSSYLSSSPIHWAQLGGSIGVSALLAAFFYLKSSPLPSDIFEEAPTPSTTTVKTTEITQTKN